MTQLENILFLDIYGTYVRISMNSKELLSRLEKDFSFFISNKKISNFDFSFVAKIESESSMSIPSHFKVVRKSKNSKTFDYKNKRFNDYYGKLLSFYDYEKEEAHLSSAFIEKLHEITYLLILSRVGKKMDLEGLHKVHAFGVIYKKVCCLGMMNMGTGKSTLLMKLLKNKEVSIISDDTPLIKGSEVLSFPLRVGLSEMSLDFDFIDKEKNLYSLEREEYGLKRLACLDAFENDIGGSYSSLIILEGFRDDTGGPRLLRSSRFALWVALQKHMVIGVGLPIIFEYFWEYGVRDFIVKANIFFLRQFAAIRLARESKHYKFYMSNNPQENADYLMKELERVNQKST